VTSIHPSVSTAYAGSASAADQTSAATAKPAAVSGQPATTFKDDTIKLSLAANIQLMHHQGLSPSIIASRLGISVKQVDTYIPGAAQAAPAAVPAAASAPEAPETKAAPASPKSAVATPSATGAK
jgi:hypothetical protein